MRHHTHEILDALKRTRIGKKLTQRELSDRTGVPQSHISKIESGGTDIRLSSLIELARALDMELKLVPRQAETAVDQITQHIEKRRKVQQSNAQAAQYWVTDVSSTQRPAYLLDEEESKE